MHGTGICAGQKSVLDAGRMCVQDRDSYWMRVECLYGAGDCTGCGKEVCTGQEIVLDAARMSVRDRGLYWMRK